METPKSLATGAVGKLIGAERSLAGLPHATRSGAQNFADEVARANERFHGDGLQAKRLGGQQEQRREARRAGFGQQKSNDEEARPSAANFHSEQGPVHAQPAVAPLQQRAQEPAGSADGDLLPTESSMPAQSAEGAANASAAAASAPDPTATSTNASASPPGAASADASSAASAEVPPAPAANAAEPTPLELAQILRTSAGKPAKVQTQTSSGPDPALLERANEILRQIELHASPGVRRLTLELHPAELGHLAVQLALRAGKVTAIVRAERPETLQLLASRQRDLEDVLARRGVHADSIRFELGFGGARSDARAQQNATPEPSPSAAASASATTPSTTTPSTSPPTPRRGTSLVDTFA